MQESAHSHYPHLAETKDRTLEEIDEMFMNVSPRTPYVPATTCPALRQQEIRVLTRQQKVPARQFKHYIITKQVQGISVHAEIESIEHKAAVAMVEKVEAVAV